MTDKEVVISGAGLVGTLLACLLSDKGYNITVFEKRPDLEKVSLSKDKGRSINLALSHRGWKALSKIGIAEEVKKCAIPMYGRELHHTDSTCIFQPYGDNDQAIYAITRKQLNILLLKYAKKKKNIQFFFESKLDFIEPDKKVLHIKKMGRTEKITYDRLIGADGAFSMVRQTLEKQYGFNFSQTFLDYGYKELSIPASDASFALKSNALHIWPRNSFMLIALPNFDRSFTLTLFYPLKGKNSFAELNSREKVLSFFKQNFGDVYKEIPDLVQQFTQNPTSSLVTIKCNPWSNKNGILLIGDAAHAIVPFYGQGMNAGFEDCTILMEHLAQSNYDWGLAIKSFEQSRIQDTNAISTLALQNFIEMRDKVSDPKFLLQKKIEAKLSREIPDQWKTLYSMITFSDTPYNEALKKGLSQDWIMQQLMNDDAFLHGWESKKVSEHHIIRSYLKKASNSKNNTNLKQASY